MIVTLLVLAPLLLGLPRPSIAYHVDDYALQLRGGGPLGGRRGGSGVANGSTFSNVVGSFASGVKEGYKGSGEFEEMLAAESSSVDKTPSREVQESDSVSSEQQKGADRGISNQDERETRRGQSISAQRRATASTSQEAHSDRSSITSYQALDLSGNFNFPAEGEQSGQGALESVLSSALISAATLVVTQVLATAWMSLIQRAQTRMAVRRKFLRQPDQKSAHRLTDVIGCDEAKVEVEQILDFLTHPNKFWAQGMRVPRGVLLCGPPGTGKTLLARAVAAEAGVPFLYVGGSEFNHKYAGMGVRMVEEIFRIARRLKRCIIFIDEIDYVGKARGGGDQSLSLDREATLNQLLAEMDGFVGKENVVVMASTNRQDVLDAALLRSGRFDLHIHFDPPDVRAREKLFLLYMSRMNVTMGHIPSPLNQTLAQGVDDACYEIGSPSEGPGFFTMLSKLMHRFVDLFTVGDMVDTISLEQLSIAHGQVAEELASLTPGCVGADVENICNTAQLIAARGNRTCVYMDDFSEAIDRITAGLAKSLATPEDERISTAVHETGHALVAWLLPLGGLVNKISIVHRGQALGYTSTAPEERFTATRAQILDEVCVGLAGRAAEEVIIGQSGSGAISDLRHASDLLLKMITRFGFGSSIGLYSPPSESLKMSNGCCEAVEAEVQKLLVEQYKRAMELVQNNSHLVKPMVELLLDKEVVHRDEIEAMWGKKITRDTGFMLSLANSTYLDISTLVNRTRHD